MHATDGDIGRVQGLVIDAKTRQVTHVLLQEGHLWGQRELAIPIGAVAGVRTASGSRYRSRRCKTCRPLILSTRTSSARRSTFAGFEILAAGSTKWPRTRVPVNEGHGPSHGARDATREASQEPTR